MNEYRPYRVTLVTTQTVVYVVDARTPEQAEDIADEMFADGEQPHDLVSTDTQIESVEQAEELTSDEVYSDGTGFRT